MVTVRGCEFPIEFQASLRRVSSLLKELVGQASTHEHLRLRLVYMIAARTKRIKI